MAKLYINLRSAHGVETVDEHDSEQLTPRWIEEERLLREKESGKQVRRMSATWANRLRARRECAEANRGQPGHYISTRCTKEWRAK